VHPINSDNGVNEMKKVIHWNTGCQYDSLGQTMSAWSDEKNDKVYFVDGSRSISGVIDGSLKDQYFNPSLRTYVKEQYNNCCDRRPETDEEDEILRELKQQNNQYRETLAE